MFTQKKIDEINESIANVDELRKSHGGECIDVTTKIDQVDVFILDIDQNDN